MILFFCVWFIHWRRKMRDVILVFFGKKKKHLQYSFEILLLFNEICNVLMPLMFQWNTERLHYSFYMYEYICSNIMNYLILQVNYFYENIFLCIIYSLSFYINYNFFYKCDILMKEKR